MKTITLDMEAYDMLAALKVDAKDSFSKVVKRHFRKSRRIGSSAGSWDDMTDEEATELRRETVMAFDVRQRKR